MTSRDFCYWLQGLFELGKPETLDAAQTELVRKHLAMVFIHEIDPSFPAGEQAALDAAHSGPTKPPAPQAAASADGRNGFLWHPSPLLRRWTN